MNAKPVYVVTGASGGIGLEIARQLARSSSIVAIIGRDRSRTDRACMELRTSTQNEEVHPFIADLGLMSDVTQVAKQLQEAYPSITGLVNNAALITAGRELTDEGLERMFAVNYLAPFLLTKLLTPNLLSGSPSHVINVASNAHRWAKTLDFDNLQAEQKFDFRIAYGTQKLCNILHAFEFSRRYAEEGVTANAHHPGEVATNLGNNGPWYMRVFWKLAARGRLSPDEGAEPIVADLLEPKTTSCYFERGVEVKPTIPLAEASLSKKLWEHSEDLLGQHNPT